MPGLNYQTSPNLELVKTALDELRDNALLEQTTAGKVDATDALAFTQIGLSDRAAYVSSVIGGGGYFRKTVTGVAQDVSLKKNVTKTAYSPRVTIVAEFNQDVPISRSFMMDQQKDAVAKSIRQQTLAWTATRDQNAFSAWAFGFGTTINTTLDAVALFTHSHTNLNGDTVDNYITGSLSDANVNTGIVTLRAQKNQGGVIVGYEPKFLLTGSTQHHDAMIVTKSVLRAGTGANDLNYFSELYPGLKVVWNQFIDNSGASNQTTMWFLGTAQHGVVRIEREAFFSKLVDWTVDAEDQYKYKLRAREEVDTIEYAGTVGSDGTV